MAKNITLETPDGRRYTTSNPTEAEHLKRTRGYRDAPKTKAAQAPENMAAAPAADK